MPLLLNWRLYLVLAVLALGGWGGWWANSWMNPPAAVLPPVTNTVVVERVVTKTVTVSKQPDGTETTTTTETTEDTSTNTSKPTNIVTYKPKWSVEGLMSLKPQGYTVPKPEWSALLYHRLWDTNAWAGAGYDFGNKAALLAVRIDF